MMMNFSGIMVGVFPLEIFLMSLSGIFYIFCAAFLWKPYRKEGNELIGALFFFLVYQALNMFFMGVEMYTHNIVYSNIASLAVFVGSVYMLKFPFSSFSKRTRDSLFILSLIVALGVYLWFMQTMERQMELMHFILWYDLIINGIVVGGFMLMLGFSAKEKWFRVKALGGGSGIVTCCIVANSAMLSGALITSSVFGFIAPVLILGSLAFARKNQVRV